MTIKAAKGGADSNSYVTITEADAFFEGYYDSRLWDALEGDDDTKEKLLRTATAQIDQLPINSDYCKAAPSQALVFPLRTGDAEHDGWAEVKQATCWQALYILDANDTIKESVINSIFGLKGEGFGGVSRSFTGLNMLRKWHPEVLNWLGHYTDFSVKTKRYSSKSYTSLKVSG